MCEKPLAGMREGNNAKKKKKNWKTPLLISILTWTWAKPAPLQK